jgi:hypothetical protein
MSFNLFKKAPNSFPKEALLPMSLVRSHLRYDVGEDGAMLQSYRDAALAYVLKRANMVVAGGTFQEEQPQWGTGEEGEQFVEVEYTNDTLRLVFTEDEYKTGNIIELFSLSYGAFSVSSFKYYNDKGEEAEWGFSDTADIDVAGPIYPFTADLSASANPKWIQFREVETPDDLDHNINTPYIIDLTGGIVPSDFSPQLKQATLLLISHFDVNREAVVTGSVSRELQKGVDSLITSAWRP